MCRELDHVPSEKIHLMMDTGGEEFHTDDKNIGRQGPCLIPLEGEKKGVRLPLAMTAMLEVVIPFMMSLLIFGGNLKWIKAR